MNLEIPFTPPSLSHSVLWDTPSTADQIELYCFPPNYHCLRAPLVAQIVKNPPAMRETWIRSLGWEDPLEEGTTTHSPVFLPGESPQTEEPARLQSIGLQKVRYDWVTKHSTHTAVNIYPVRVQEKRLLPDNHLLYLSLKRNPKPLMKQRFMNFLYMNYEIHAFQNFIIHI